jgi:transcription initiation factor IIE alpha subunit
MNKIRLGRKEKEILAFLSQHQEGVWKEELKKQFSWTKKYDNIINRRLYRLQEKGLIIIKQEINPETGRVKQRVYLKQ